MGLTPSQAIVAATKNGALACRLSNGAATLASGELADVLVLGRDPLTDIRNLRSVEVVIKGGAY